MKRISILILILATTLAIADDGKDKGKGNGQGNQQSQPSSNVNNNSNSSGSTSGSTASSTGDTIGGGAFSSTTAYSPTSSSSSNSGPSTSSATGGSSNSGSGSIGAFGSGNTGTQATGGQGGSSSSGSNATNGSVTDNSKTTNSNIAGGGQGGQGGQGGAGGKGGSASSSSNAKGGSANGNGSNNRTSSYSGVDGSGNSASISQGGKATGGKAYAGVDGSGNSTVNIGGSVPLATSSTSQGQESSNANQSSASNSGNNSSYSSSTQVDAPKIPVATAVGTTVIPGTPCYKTYGGAGQGMAAGVSIGGGKIDGGCDAREYARYYKELLGSRIAACKMLVSQKRSKKAGVTLEDCMLQDAPAPHAEFIAPAPLPVQPIVVSVLAPPQAAASVPVPTPMFVSSIEKLDNVTKHKLDEAILLLKQDNDGHLLLRRGDAVAAASLVYNIHKYLLESGADDSRIEIAIGGSSDVVDLLWAR